MKKRGLVIGLLIMLALVTSGFTYAIWSSVELGTDTVADTITIGEGRQASSTVTLTSTLPADATLVPVGEVATSIGLNPVDELTFTFTVLWEDNMFPADDSTLTISVTDVNNATEDLSPAAIALLNFAFTDGTDTGLTYTITEGSTLTITLTVTLTEPTTQLLYDEIINEDITFDVNFTVTDPAL